MPPSSSSHAAAGGDCSAQQVKTQNGTKPVIVGIYGVSGCGKSFFLGQLKEALEGENFLFFEGSDIIASLFPDGLSGFQKLPEEEKGRYRQLAIDKIRSQCIAAGAVGVMAGHAMFWSEEDAEGTAVYTQDDLDTLTHVLYLHTNPSIILQRRQQDRLRARPGASIGRLKRWQHAEQAMLRRVCNKNDILFAVLRTSDSSTNWVEMVTALLRDFSAHTEKSNMSKVLATVDGHFSPYLGVAPDCLSTVLVFDGDKTLSPADTGTLFWQMCPRDSQLAPPLDEGCPLRRIFKSPLGYSYNAFRQAALLYEVTAEQPPPFEMLCQMVAAKVKMYDEALDILRQASIQPHVRIIIVTCGLQRIWQNILTKAGLGDSVTVIGGGRLTDLDTFIVTPAVKAAIVKRLREVHGLTTHVFGDSPLDLPMMREANRAVVVVGETKTRSRSMETELHSAITKDGLQACQILLPSTVVEPRLTNELLPRVKLDDPTFIQSIFGDPRKSARNIQIRHATDKNSAKLLMTPMRDAAVSGPQLREAHHMVGKYLAIEFLADLVGAEEYPVKHVLGHSIAGFRLREEKHTSIVAIMRAGEPMALGVNDAFPTATFVHVYDAEELERHQLGRTVILVDSVINSGKTIVEFIHRIRHIDKEVEIFVVTGVLQIEAIPRIERAAAGDKAISVVALRISLNKFTGKGGTDTGNRLFNTVHLD